MMAFGLPPPPIPAGVPPPSPPGSSPRPTRQVATTHLTGRALGWLETACFWALPCPLACPGSAHHCAGTAILGKVLLWASPGAARRARCRPAGDTHGHVKGVR